MTKVKEPTGKTTLEKIAEQLLVAQKEIDEFVVQMALGKAEAKDEFEEIKKQFRARVHEFKLLLNDLPRHAMSPNIKQRIDELEVQLALGKAETKDQFEDQKNKLLKAINGIEAAVNKWIGELENSPTFGHEIEKFKLKLEILRLRFSLKKIEVKDEFKEQMAKTKKVIEKLSKKAHDKVAAQKIKYRDFSNEITQSYDHLKSAIRKL